MPIIQLTPTPTPPLAPTAKQLFWSGKNDITVWDLEAGKEAFVLSGMGEETSGVSFSLRAFNLRSCPHPIIFSHSSKPHAN